MLYTIPNRLVVEQKKVNRAEYKRQIQNICINVVDKISTVRLRGPWIGINISRGNHSDVGARPPEHQQAMGLLRV
jgi:hypothetical protein